MSKFPAIPEVTKDLDNITTVLRAMKENIEILTRQRGTTGGNSQVRTRTRSSAVTWDDLIALAIVDEDKIPK